MRQSLRVDVKALQKAVSDAAIPASKAFPIFDAAGLRQAVARRTRVCLPSPSKTSPSTQAHGSGSSRAGRALGTHR